MALTSWSTANYLRRLSAVINAYGFALDGWGYIHTLGSERSAMFAGNASNEHWSRSYVGFGDANNQVLTSTRSGADGTDAIWTTTTVSADTWFYFTGTEYVNLREAYLNAGGRQASTYSMVGNPSTADRFYVGTNTDVSGSWDSAGAMGELAVWNLGSMDQTQRESLWTKRNNGDNPLAINAEAAQPWTGALVAYWRLTNTSDLTDLSGNGHDLSMVGTLTNWGGTAPPVDDVPSSEVLMGQACL
jgi:hypothetical protein